MNTASFSALSEDVFYQDRLQSKFLSFSPLLYHKER